MESEKAMENVEAMSVIANANDTLISNSPLKKPAQTLQKRQSEEYIREVKRLCLKDQEISELNCTDDFNCKNVLIQFPNILKIPVVINMVMIKIPYVQMKQIGKKLLNQWKPLRQIFYKK